MKVIGVHCPYCGGNVKFDIDTGIKHCFCVHCGQQIILDDEVIRTEHVEIKRDETRIHEADIRERIRLKELDIEAKEAKKSSRLFVFKVIVTILFLLMEALFIVLMLGIFTKNRNDEGLLYYCLVLFWPFVAGWLLSKLYKVGKKEKRINRSMDTFSHSAVDSHIYPHPDTISLKDFLGPDRESVFKPLPYFDIDDDDDLI